jgi:hypothetical protein
MFSKQDKPDPKWEEVNVKGWQEAEALSNAILSFAEEERGWFELKNLLGNRSPDVVDRAFHMALYEYLCAISRNRKKPR